MSYSITDLQKRFSAQTLALGRDLAKDNRVHTLNLRDNLITAVVDNEPGGRNFRVYVRTDTEMVTECSCGGSPTCEHIAAALLAALDRQNSSQAAVENNKKNAVKRRQTGVHHSVSEQKLLYLLLFEPGINTSLGIKTQVVRQLPNGDFSNASPYSPEKADKNNPSRFLQEEDYAILAELAQNYKNDDSAFLNDVNSDRLLQAMIRTGRCHLYNHQIQSPSLQNSHSHLIQWGTPRPLTLNWRMDDTGTQHLHWQVTPAANAILAVANLYYMDENRQQCGEIQSPLPAPLLIELLNQPALSASQAARLKTRMAKDYPHLKLPQLKALEVERTVKARPIACLRLLSLLSDPENSDSNGISIPCAELYFDYAGIAVRLDTPSTYFDGKSLIHIERDSEFEQQCRQRLVNSGFRALRREIAKDRDLYKLSAEPLAWIDFQYDVMPQLINDHWRIDYDPGFELRAVHHQQWYCETHRTDNADWFDFTLGVYLDGERINLLPVLLEFIKQYSPEEALELNIPHYSLQIRERQWIRISSDRLHAIFNSLISLYTSKTVRIPHSLRLPLYRLANISEMVLDEILPEPQWVGDRDLQDLANNLRQSLHLPQVTAPRTLNTELRPYQQSGLNWLQFLRAQHLAGILADDMGLGKTVQTLANLLIEKQQGRMTEPSLIIAPTSLVFNWRNEICRLSPSLSVLCLHGAKRHRHFASMKKYDIVITSYPLLLRDEEQLLACRYHYLILDEAHYIKNPKAKASRCVRNITARHKLCLSGTPLENHLGELWSLFDFLLPGYLGNQRQFKTLFRTPIEKQADYERAEALARRVRPFMLRRTKDAVARELPEKTEIIQAIPLTQAQQDLYETVRLSVHRNVRGAIEREGLARSQITILDALLKLRQVCCDPRLVKLEKTQDTVDSAKLALLTEIIPEMIEEGRRILLFSQFTSMLALIETEMEKLGINYAKLTGQTVDRAEQVERFQSRKTPLFLISLKAGGVGLNLTAADTVIHYDPWWNPAVEQQATDRAHRIGQTQPVFVYKLICEGTVEEKILALQQNKKGLAESIFQAPNSQGQPFSEEEIDELLAPLE